MSKINAIRLINVNYNHDAIHVSDETLHLNGQSTLISLQNGGGKSVLVQLLTAPFVQKRYRNVKERPFYSYFTSTKPSFILVEWLLENNGGHCLTGMMVHKNPSLDDDEKLDLVAIISEYKEQCAQDIHHLPVVEHKENEVSLKSFGACRELFEGYKKEKPNKFFYFDLNNQAQSRQYFAKLAEYGIDYREWQNIIRKINEEESGLSKLFVDCKDETGLLDKWFLDAVENKLNKDENRMQKFRELLGKYIQAYSNNVTKIEQQEKLQQFLQELGPVKEQGEAYAEATRISEEKLAKILAYLKELQRLVTINEQETVSCQEELASLHEQLLRLAYEEYSTKYYALAAQEDALTTTKEAQQARRTELESKVKELQMQLNIYDCASAQERLDADKLDLKRAEQELDVLRRKNKELEPERDYLGFVLRQHWEKRLRSGKEAYAALQEESKACAAKLKETQAEQQKLQERIEALNKEKGRLDTLVGSYDEEENRFCKKWHVDLQRNMLGEYEAGTLEILAAKIADAQTEAKQNLDKCQKEQQDAKTALKELERKQQDVNNELNANKTAFALKKQEKIFVDEQLAKRRTLLQYLQLPEENLFEQEKIAKALELKLTAIDSSKNKLQQELVAVQKQRESLQTGRTLELAPELVQMLEQLGIQLVYGMEWLKKNGYDEAQNLALVEQHPFLPYALLMTAKDVALLEQAPKSIFTSFPVPIMLRESLKEAGTQKSANGIFKCADMHFLMLFNNNLLNEAKLQELLQKLAEEQNVLAEKVARRKEEYDTYQNKYGELKQQSFTKASYTKLLQELAALQDKDAALQEEYIAAKKAKKQLEEKLEELAKDVKKLEDSLRKITQQQEECQQLGEKYKQYVQHLALQQECEEQLRKLKQQMLELNKEISALQDSGKEYVGKLNDLRHELERVEEVFTKFSSYKQAKMPKGFELALLNDMDGLQARFDAIMKKASGDLKNLVDRRSEIAKKVQDSQKDLDNQAALYALEPEAWQGIRFNREKVVEFTKERQAAENEQKLTYQGLNETNMQLAKVQERKQRLVQDMEKECEQREPLPMQELVAKDFAALRGQLRGQEHSCNENLRKLENQGKLFHENIGALGAFSGQETQAVWSGEENFADFAAEELRLFTADLQKEYGKSVDNQKKAQEKLEKILQNLQTMLNVNGMQEDVFTKPLAALQKLTDSAQSFLQKLQLILDSLTTQAAKLKADLEFVEQEMQHVIALLEDYVQAVHREMGTIDHNSTIKVRGRSVKMLELKLPVWEDNANVYHLHIKDLVEKLTEQGLALLQQNKPIEELLGKSLTTKNLYHEVIGLNNVRVKLYKIEAQREVPISWREVARNSGGEGFLSAFVILSSLLYYMRRDKTDIFADRNEGKVLIMDNPFAQTNAAHLLTPMMDMARKNNTQLISLTGLGGDSIYNCYDNIYVLNLIASKLSHVRYLKSKHLAGEEAEVLSLARVEVTNDGEMPSLF